MRRQVFKRKKLTLRYLGIPLLKRSGAVRHNPEFFRFFLFRLVPTYLLFESQVNGEDKFVVNARELFVSILFLLPMYR